MNAQEMEAMQGKAFQGSSFDGRYVFWFFDGTNWPLAFDPSLGHPVFDDVQAGMVPQILTS